MTTINKIKRAVLAALIAITALCIAAAFNTVGCGWAAYAEEEATYYAVLNGVTPEGEAVDINGQTAYPLSEYDSRYVSGKYYIGEIDEATKYAVYRAEDAASGERVYKKAMEGTVEEADVGYYTFNYDPSKVYSEGAYAERIAESYGGWYFCASTNGYLHSSSGEVTLYTYAALREVETDDSEYSRVYKQYKYNFTIEESDLSGGDVTFCITNGESIYKAGENYGVISKAGNYRLIFCENRTYETGYHYTVSERNSAPAEATDYYLCLSSQGYSVLASNRLSDLGNYEYQIENVSLSSSVKFYICDENGSKWYNSEGDEMSVSSDSSLAYDIKFSPNKVYTGQSEWENTSCHITYKLYSPDSYSLTVNSSTYPLTYNSTVTGHDEYYISSIYLYSGDALSVSGYSESHAITQNGYYRILFTPARTLSGDAYKFDENGNYGTGDGYDYNIYIEKAPLYYAVFECDIAVPPSSQTEINGEKAYLLTRDETATAEKYKSEEFFVGERDFTVKAKIYEYITSSDSYKEVTLDVDSADITYVGWYTLSLTTAGDADISVSAVSKSHGGYYAAGSFNGYLYAANGDKNLSSDYRFTEIEEEDDDYNEDYEQYVLYIEVTSKALKEGEYEFFITDGVTRYTNAGDYITIAEAGRYKILFSPEHIYGRGRYYRYTLEASSVDKDDLEISSAEEFITFAEECNADAEYSTGLNVYLTADIDFSGKDFVSVKLFNGYFNGGYHSLKNISISEDEGNEVGVFCTLSKGAIIERVTIESLNITAENSEKVGFVAVNYGIIRSVKTYGEIKGEAYVGGIAGYNGRSEIESDDPVEDSSDAYIYAKIEKCYSECAVTGKTNVGGIAGYSGGKIISSSFAGGANAVSHNSSDRIVNTGGIAGYSTGVIDSCEMSGAVGYKNTGIYVGGIVGFSSGEVYFSKNSADVYGNAYTGGIVGYLGALSSENSSDSLNAYFGGMNYEEFIERYFSDDGEDFTAEADGGVFLIVYCINSGDVTSESYAGGIVGRVSAPSTNTISSASTSSDSSSSDSSSSTMSVTSTVRVDSSASYGNVYTSAGNYAGGIAAYQASGEIINCLAAGDIKAEGVSSGKYVGGIAGYGTDIKYCASFSSLSGEGYIGGIAGEAAGTLKGCYSDCSLLTPDALYTGLIAGYADEYDPAAGDFNEKVEDNFFLGEGGGINKMNYGEQYLNAARSLTAEQLISVNELSPYLSEGFSSDNWIASLSENGYPVLKAFEEAVECSSYGAEEDFKKAFSSLSAEFMAISQKYCVRSYTITFLEWNEDDGDLYSDDGTLNKENFDVISSVRIRYGESPSYPAFKYAEEENGKYIYNGDEASYFVSWGSFDPFAAENTLVYAEYGEIYTSLTDENESIFAEGKFEEGESVKIEYSGEYFTIKFYKGDEEVEESDVRVKILVENPSSVAVYKTEGQALIKQESEVSGKYIAFSFTGGYYYIGASSALPAWAFAIIGAGGAIILCAAAAGIIILVKRKKSAEEPTPEE